MRFALKLISVNGRGNASPPNVNLLNNETGFAEVTKPVVAGLPTAAPPSLAQLAPFQLATRMSVLFQGGSATLALFQFKVTKAVPPETSSTFQYSLGSIYNKGASAL